MEINVFYEPLRLIKQKNIIESENKGRIDYENPPEGYIAKKIKEIMSISDSKLVGYSELLKEYELEYLAYYLPKEKNLAINKKIRSILMHRASQNILDCYYMSWQNYYDSLPENYNTETLAELSSKGKYTESYKLSYENLTLMCSKSPHIVFSSLISDYGSWSNSDFEVTMHNVYKIKSYTRLGKMIIKARYLYCSAKDLMKVNEGFLCDLTNEYDKDERTQFFVNFVTKMETKKLSSYLDLEAISERYIGPKTEQFKNLSAKTQSLFLTWYSVRKIFDIFGEDERGVFWRARALEYKAENAVLYKHFGLAVITFENFIATEFLEASDGPMYIVPKKVYENEFSDILRRNHEKQDLKSALYHKYNGSDYRIVHSKNWRDTALYTIRKYSQ